MYNPIENSELRRAARERLKGNWGGPILACFIFIVIIIIIGSIPIIGSIITLLITGAFTLGITLYFLEFVGGTIPKVDVIFKGFNYFTKSLGLYLLMTLYIILWSLLLIVPGIIMSFAYSQAFFILAENPDMKITDILKTSTAMMKGYKMKCFLLGLSFIGWALLSALTFGIGYLWLMPYMQTTFVNFYLDIKNAYSSNQPAAL